MRQFISFSFPLVTFPLGLNIHICTHMHTIWKGKGEKNVYVRIKGQGDRGGSEDVLLTLYPSLKYSYMFLYDVVPLPCSYRIRSLSTGLGQQVVEKFEYIIHFKKEINNKNMHPKIKIPKHVLLILLGFVRLCEHGEKTEGNLLPFLYSKTWI